MKHIRAESPGRTHTADATSWRWQDAAACAGEDLVLFFGSDGERQAEKELRETVAKEICAACPAQRECLDHAITLPEKAGIWGGMTPDERHAERRRRWRREKAAAPAPKVKPKPKPKSRSVPATGAVRRLKAAAAVGRTLRVYAHHTGIPETSLLKIRTGVWPYIPEERAKAIADAYPLVLALTQPPHKVPLQSAAEQGWPGPEAWEGVDIDDPTAQPRQTTAAA